MRLAVSYATSVAFPTETPIFEFKGKITEIARQLKAVDGVDVKRKIAEEGKYVLSLEDGTTVELSPDLLTFKEALPENMMSIDTTYGRIYLDTSRTPELLAESIAKEMIRRTQVMRKEMNLRVEEYVDAAILVGEEEILKALESLRDFIAVEVRAKKLTLTDKEESFSPAKAAYVRSWDIDGEAVRIAVTRLEEKKGNAQ